MKCEKCKAKADHKVITKNLEGKNVINWFCEGCLKLNELTKKE